MEQRGPLFYCSLLLFMSLDNLSHGLFEPPHHVKIGSLNILVNLSLHQLINWINWGVCVLCFLYFQKYNMFLAQIGCAAIGVVAFSVFGPGWLSRSVALAASIAFMVIARANHPPGILYLLILLFHNSERKSFLINRAKYTNLIIKPNRTKIYKPNW